MKIYEEVDGTVAVYGNGIDPDDLAFGRVKPLRSFKTYDEAEAFIDGYNQRLGDMIREGSVIRSDLRNPTDMTDEEIHEAN